MELPAVFGFCPAATQRLLTRTFPSHRPATWPHLLSDAAVEDLWTVQLLCHFLLLLWNL